MVQEAGLKCRLLCDKSEAARRLEAWARSPEGRARIKADAKVANEFIAEFKRRRNVSQEILDRRVTI